MTNSETPQSEPQALVIVSHGSHHHPWSSKPAIDHAARVRNRHLFSEVRVAFWKEEPSLRDVPSLVRADRVFIVPLLTSDGYFADEVFPRELRSELATDLKTHYTDPIGTHEAMVDVIIDRVTAVAGDSNHDQATGLALIGHGTERNPNSAQATRRHASAIRETDRFEEVRTLFLDESPSVTGLLDHFTTDRIVVVPFFIADGHHTTKDIPAAIGISPKTEKPPYFGVIDGRQIWYTGAIGTHAGVAEVIVERALQAGASPGPIDTDSASTDRLIASQIDEFIAAAPSGIDFDGLTTTATPSGITVRIADRRWTPQNEDDLRRIAKSNLPYITNWHVWERQIRGHGTPRRAFLRWIERADQRPLEPRHAALKNGLVREWGEVLITASMTSNGGRRYRVVHHADRDRPLSTLNVFTTPHDAHSVVRFDDNQQYRPLRGARSLPTGWAFADLNGNDLVRTIDIIYPATITSWYHEQTELNATPFIETATRQSGRYDQLQTISKQDLETTINTVCGTCVKQPVWHSKALETRSTTATKSRLPCREACSFFLEAARTVDKEEANEPPSCSEGAGESAVGDSANPANHTRNRHRQRRLQLEEMSS